MGPGPWKWTQINQGQLGGSFGVHFGGPGLKMGSAGLNNFFLLDQVKGHCEPFLTCRLSISPSKTSSRHSSWEQGQMRSPPTSSGSSSGPTWRAEARRVQPALRSCTLWTSPGPGWELISAKVQLRENTRWVWLQSERSANIATLIPRAWLTVLPRALRPMV